MEAQRRTPITLITEPTVIQLAEMTLLPQGLDALARWVSVTRPECVPELDPGQSPGAALFPHDMTGATDNELLAELAGRTCYMSFGKKAGRKSNAEYIAHTQEGTVPHRSILYHAKMSFFVAGVSRHLTHELMRHYVGADRDAEGSPSQESTRYTWAPGNFIVPPRILAQGGKQLDRFREDMQEAYENYLDYVDSEVAAWKNDHGTEPKGLDRKRIYEAAAGHLPHHVATSVVWTSNPVALSKMFLERDDLSAGLEFRRLTRVWHPLCAQKYRSLFPPLRG